MDFPPRTAAVMTTDRVTPLLRGALLPTLVVAALVVAASTVVAGSRGLVGASVGAAVVLVFSGVGLLAMRAVRTMYPEVVLLVAVGSYFVRVVIFGGLLAILGTVDGIDDVLNRTATALAVLACVATWLAGELRAFVRMRQPIYDFDDRPSASSTTGGANSSGGAS
ncbi:ATP synthase protein I [Actinopolymorpha cephalotaxi]|uniref:ATP synthase protein I n=2 Tax=Actinopolymorpha cephalotaxi TaxID=504797 RepID=A0A1I2ZDT1_9ACTN|nr:ATP synthase protein I [Actinopolymorpha cephalotaxi]